MNTEANQVVLSYHTLVLALFIALRRTKDQYITDAMAARAGDESLDARANAFSRTSRAVSDMDSPLGTVQTLRTELEVLDSRANGAFSPLLHQATLDTLFELFPTL